MLNFFERWRDGASEVDREDDEKLHALRDTLHDVVEAAREDAEAGEVSDKSTEASFRQNRESTAVLILRRYGRLDL